MLFAIVTGITGYTLVIQNLATVIDIPMGVQKGLSYFAFGIYLLISFLYLNKINLYPKNFSIDLPEPNYMGFISIIPVATILIATALFPYNENLSLLLWGIGGITQLMLMIRIVTLWITFREANLIHTDPSWFIPAVGCLSIPIVGVKVVPVEISWFFFSLGLLYWTIVVPIYFYRNIYHHTVEEDLTPTLFILMAPSSVGAVAWHSLTGEVDAFFRTLYSLSLFLFFVSIMQYKIYFSLKLFHLSWWSLSFSVATPILATFTIAEALNSQPLVILGMVKTTFLSLILITLIWKSLQSIIIKNSLFKNPAEQSHLQLTKHG